MLVQDHIYDEVEAQTGATPVNCRPSQHGPDPATGRGTWVVSFTKTARPFRLFGDSGLSRLITKKTSIPRHDPGCQGYCNPLRCQRKPRCGHCGERMDRHDPGECAKAPQCANCFHPLPAGHDSCPAAPSLTNGAVKKPTKKQLKQMREAGKRSYRRTNRAPADPPLQGPSPLAGSRHDPQAAARNAPQPAADASEPTAPATLSESSGSSEDFHTPVESPTIHVATETMPVNAEMTDRSPQAYRLQTTGIGPVRTNRPGRHAGRRNDLSDARHARDTYGNI